MTDGENRNEEPLVPEETGRIHSSHDIRQTFEIQMLCKRCHACFCHSPETLAAPCQPRDPAIDT
jgi:hypothetical protein